MPSQPSKISGQTPVSFRRNLLPLFDVGTNVACMKGIDPGDGPVLLLNYEFMKAHADKILTRLLAKGDGDSKYDQNTDVASDGNDRMPLGGPYWSKANLLLFEQWIKDGYQP